MVETLKENYHINKLKKKCEEIVNTCEICQTCKVRKKYGNLKKMKIEYKPWKTFSLDIV